MEKPNFTPGPWLFGEINEHGGYDCMTAGVRVGPVVLDAADYGQKRCEELPEAITGRMIADAHLIAAAPELYEALRSLLDELNLLMGASDGVSGLHLNGDLAPWADLTPGGNYEHLGSILQAYDALQNARGE